MTYRGIFTEDVEVEGLKILEMEALELHKLESMISLNKGLSLDRNTDAIRYAKNVAINISIFIWDSNGEVPKYLE